MKIFSFSQGTGLTNPLTGTLSANNNLVSGANGYYFNSEIDNGSSGTSKQIDWTTGGVQKITLTGNCTFTFVAPPGVGKVQLKLIQDGTGSRTVTWPSMKWAGGTPTLTTTATTGTDIVTIFYDGAAYWGVASLNFT